MRHLSRHANALTQRRVRMNGLAVAPASMAAF